MFIEHAELTVPAERAEAFQAAFEEGRKVIAQAPGFQWAELWQGVERPGTHLLLVGWETVEAHTVGFRGSELFTRWRAAVGPYFSAPPAVEHYASVGPRHVG